MTFLLILLLQTPHLSEVAPGPLNRIHVVDVLEQKVQPDQRVTLRDDKIAAIGPAQQQGASNGSPLYLIPGYVDMHAHIPATDGLLSQEAYLTMQMAAGVTNLRNMRHRDGHLVLRERVEAGDIPGPRLYLAAPPISRKSDFSGLAVDIAAWKQAGYDLLKVFSVPGKENYQSLAEMAKAHDIMLAGHLPRGVQLETAIALKQTSIEHLQGFKELWQKDRDAFQRQVEASIQNGVWHTATVDWYYLVYMRYSQQELEALEGLELIPEAMRQDWQDKLEKHRQEEGAKTEEARTADAQKRRKEIEVRPEVIRALHRAGVPLLLSSAAEGFYSIPGFSMYQEMAHHAEAGLAPAEILKIATYNPALYWGEQDQWGQIREGYRADFTVLNINPLTQVPRAENVVGVVIGGKWYPKSELTARLKTLTQEK